MLINQSMESNGGIPVAGMMPGMLGLEMPLHQQQSQQQQHRHIPQHHQMPLFAQQQQAARHPYATIQRPPSTAVTTTTTRQQHASSYSDEEEAASGCGAEDGSGDGKQRGGSPWQRMKWTDEMVRLLIMVVFLVGDDSGSVDASSSAADGKKKHPAGSGSSGGGGAGAIQKKGKWKSVSRAMLEKGFRVSPQQCEDKFNDLNKRYKRVVDIVGKGTSCRVVQNPSLLETMDHISPKLKEEVRKLLNSKHLFFREMCAYHSSITHQPCDADQPLALPANSLHQPPFSRPNEPRCIDRDHTDLAIVPSDSQNHHVEDEDDDDLNNEDDDEDDGDSGDQENELGGGGDVQGSCRKRLRRTVGHGEATGVPCSSLSPIHQQLRTEMASVLQDGGKSVWEQRLWVRSRSMLLEEQKVSYQCRAFEIEKQRFKWQKYSRKKEREFEGMRLENERLRLENERMILVLRQKEMEIDGMIKRSEPSNITG